jgi:hypothetical protein
MFSHVLYGHNMACSAASIISILLKLTGISNQKLTKRHATAGLIGSEEYCIWLHRALSPTNSKDVPLHAMEALGGRGNSPSFLTSALDGGEGSESRPGRALAPVPIGQEAGWASKLVWTQRIQEKSFRLCRGSKMYRSVIQPVARHYTDWATRIT